MHKGINAIERWELNTKGWKTLFQLIGKKKALDRRRKQGLLQEELLQVETCLQKELGNEVLGNQFRTVKESLRKLHNLKIHGLKVRSKLGLRMVIEDQKFSLGF